jgi:hypothetical protein
MASLMTQTLPTRSTGHATEEARAVWRLCGVPVIGWQQIVAIAR